MDSIAPTGQAVISPEASALYRRVAAGEVLDDQDREAANELLSFGLLRRDPDGGVVPVDPHYVGARMASASQAEAARQMARSADVQDAFAALGDAYAARPPGGAGMVEFLRGTSIINVRLGPVLGGCTTELLVRQPGGARRPEALAEVKVRDLETLARDVRMRTIYHEDARAGAAMHGWVAEMTAAGGEYRTLAEPFTRVIIIDRRVAVIPGADETEATAYIVHDSGIASFLAEDFSRDWERAEQWFAAGGDDSRRQVRARHEVVLRKLAAGHTNQRIAKDLGISARTLADAISELKDVYGAKTLFALGCAWTAEQRTRTELADDRRRQMRMKSIAEGVKRRSAKSDGS